MAKLKFCKMHGLGNDFMVVDAVRQSFDLSVEDIQRLGRRDIGVGFDQLLLVEPARESDIDFTYRIFNADGHEVGQCGNGARCLARFIAYQALSEKKNLTVATASTRMQLLLEASGLVTVSMPPPRFEPTIIPLLAADYSADYELPLPDGRSHLIHAVNVGNPHAVMRTGKLDSFDVEKIGGEISRHAWFPEQCNAGFMQIDNGKRMKLRVYERGCGETQACGSGAVAAAVVGRQFYGMAESITVSLAGGDLQVHWPGGTSDIQLSGPAEFVYEGVLL